MKKRLSAITIMFVLALAMMLFTEARLYAGKEPDPRKKPLIRKGDIELMKEEEEEKGKGILQKDKRFGIDPEQLTEMVDTSRIYPAGAKPDLIVENFVPRGDADPDNDYSSLFEAEIKNIGDAGTYIRGRAVIYIYAENADEGRGPAGPRHEVESYDFSETWIDPNQSIRFGERASIERLVENNTIEANHSYYVIFAVDVGDSVDEIREDNNEDYQRLTVRSQHFERNTL